MIDTSLLGQLKALVQGAQTEPGSYEAIAEALERDRVMAVLDSWEDDEHRIVYILRDITDYLTLLGPGGWKQEFSAIGRNAVRAKAAKAIEALPKDSYD